MTPRKANTEASSAASRLENEDWADILARWALMLTHMPPTAHHDHKVQAAAADVARRLPKTSVQISDGNQAASLTSDSTTAVRSF